MNADTLGGAKISETVKPVPNDLDNDDPDQAMGTTFVTISQNNAPDDPGFWMSDTVLELWLRLLALHLPEPNAHGQFQSTPAIRNQWLLASRGYFMGCVPHDLESACSTEDGRTVVRHAISSLMAALAPSDAPLDAPTLNLLGIDGSFSKSLPRETLLDVGRAFVDLLDGRISCSASSTDVMPGSKPYPVPSPNSRK